jgi:predicted transcriptional regulator
MSTDTLPWMRTTVRMEDGLLRRAKRIAAQRETTLTAILEEALREWLDRQRKRQRRERVELPVSNAGGGVRPGVDLDDSADLLERMERDGPA